MGTPRPILYFWHKIHIDMVKYIIIWFSVLNLPMFCDELYSLWEDGKQMQATAFNAEHDRPQIPTVHLISKAS